MTHETQGTDSAEETRSDHVTRWIFWFGAAYGGLGNGEVLAHLEEIGVTPAEIAQARDAMRAVAARFYGPEAP